MRNELRLVVSVRLIREVCFFEIYFLSAAKESSNESRACGETIHGFNAGGAAVIRDGRVFGCQLYFHGDLTYTEKNFSEVDVMLKKTKIICTQGPATDAPGVLEGLIEHGMNAARFNFSHGDHAGHKKRVDAVKAAAQKAGKIIALILDTKGPEMRLGEFKDGAVQLVEGNKFTLVNKDILGDETKATVTHKLLYTEVKAGDKLLLNDGLVELKIDAIVGKDIHTTILNSGKMSSRKRFAAPGVSL